MFTKPDAVWNKNDADAPEYLKRTGNQYYRASYGTVLEQRGLSNRMLDSLVTALPDGAVIAGGFVTAVVADTRDAQDIDIFFTRPDAFTKTVQMLMDPKKYLGDDRQPDWWAIMGYEPDPKTKEGVIEAAKSGRLTREDLRRVRYLKFVHKTRPPIQLIKLAWYDSAEHVIDTFDLTVAQFAIDVETCELVANPVAFLDVAKKKLVLHRLQYPSSTLRRVIKYSKKGYYASPGSLSVIAQQVADNIENDIDDPIVGMSAVPASKDYYRDE